MRPTTAIQVAKALCQQAEFPDRVIGTDIHRSHKIAGSTFDRFHPAAY